MRSAPPGLVAILNDGGPLVWADLYTITLQGGQTIRYSGADRLVTLGVNAFPLGPTIKRNGTRTSIGVSVDTLSLSIDANAGVLINTVPINAFIVSGGLDGARVRLERAFARDWNSLFQGSVLLFTGRVAEVSCNSYGSTLQVNSDTELLDAVVPRNLYQPGCMNTLYDAACGVNRAAFTDTGVVSGSLDPTRTRFDTDLTQAAGFFNLGVLTFSSGVNDGVKTTVKSHASGGVLTLITPLPAEPSPGDTFSIYAGCDKKLSTCTGKFANTIRFRGQPFIPVPEPIT